MTIREWMEQTGVKFGTSGARGLADAMTDRVCYAYTRGFLQYLLTTGEWRGARPEAAVAGDLRPSTGRIMEAVMRAIHDFGGRALHCGRVPSPALALHGFTRGCPAIMVTGSHIPADRNGIKFNKPGGEILKSDEAGMMRESVVLRDGMFNAAGWFADRASQQFDSCPTVAADYVRRYLDVFPADALRGCRVGVYQHSAVGRDVLVEVLAGLGAEVTALGRSESFIPVDTEAIRPEDVQLARSWAADGKFDAIVSADGDSDRPLIADERGRWLRGDVAGVLCARFLGADSVSTPVSCNSVVDRSGWFKEVRRTRIGSPYVVASMIEASAAGARVAVGYEANGGFLLNSDVHLPGGILRALPTRDAVIVLLAILLLAKHERRTVSELVGTLPPRFTASDRIEHFATERGQTILQRFTTGHATSDAQALEAAFATLAGRVVAVDRTDGLRVTFTSGEILHLRPSGNAPEFRVYTEAATEERATSLNAAALALVRTLA